MLTGTHFALSPNNPNVSAKINRDCAESFIVVSVLAIVTLSTGRTGLPLMLDARRVASIHCEAMF
jgi:hypothetical protein